MERGQKAGPVVRGSWKMSRAQIICTQVVPVLDLVLMTMSPSRNGKPIHLALSSSGDRYRIVVTAIPGGQSPRSMSTAGRSLTSSLVILRSITAADVVDGADRDGDILLPPEVSLLEQDMRHMVLCVDDETLHVTDRTIGRVHGIASTQPPPRRQAPGPK